MSYSTVEQADDFLSIDSIRYSAWEILDNETKLKRLQEATRRLDLIDWPGEKTNSGQENEWPRTGVFCNGDAVDSETIPKRIIQATAVLAGDIVLNPNAASSQPGNKNIKRVQAGSAVVEYIRPTLSGFSFSEASPDSFALIQCFLTGEMTRVFVSGIEEYEDRVNPGLFEGFA